MKISITVEINETEDVFGNLIDTEKLSIDVAYNKYKFDPLKDDQDKRLDYIATEISLQKADVLVGNTCYNLHEVLHLNNELKKYNLTLHTVFIPSNERIESRKKKAYEEHIKWNRLLGTSDEEIEKNVSDFKARLLAIKVGLKNTSINVLEI